MPLEVSADGSMNDCKAMKRMNRLVTEKCLNEDCWNEIEMALSFETISI